MRLARVIKLHESRDGTQRPITIAYNNVSRCKDGQWVGKQETVKRCVKDVVLVDSALNSISEPIGI